MWIILSWLLFTTLLTTALIRRSKWKLDNPDYLEIAAKKYVAKKRANRDRRKVDSGNDPERRFGKRKNLTEGKMAKGGRNKPPITKRPKKPSGQGTN